MAAKHGFACGVEDHLVQHVLDHPIVLAEHRLVTKVLDAFAGQVVTSLAAKVKDRVAGFVLGLHLNRVAVAVEHQFSVAVDLEYHHRLQREEVEHRFAAGVSHRPRAGMAGHVRRQRSACR